MKSFGSKWSIIRCILTLFVLIVFSQAIAAEDNSTNISVTKSSFEAGDNVGSHFFPNNADISFEAFKGDISKSPVVNNGALRLYANPDGGNANYITLVASEGVKIKKITYDTAKSSSKETNVCYQYNNNGSFSGKKKVTNDYSYSITNLDYQSVSIYVCGNENLELSSLIVYYTKEVSTGSFTIGSKEWATYYTDKAFVMPENAKGIIVTDNSNGNLQLTEKYSAGSIVPACTPLLINGPQGNYTYNITQSAGESAEVNYLRGQLTKGVITAEASDDCYYYKLTTGPSGTEYAGKLGFYWGAEDGGVFEIKNDNRAYLALPKSKDIKAFAFDDMETVISTIISSDNDTPLYNMVGQRIKIPVRGQVYIQNGKKYIAK